MKIHEVLAAIRISKKMSQQTLATKIGGTKSTISLWESGKTSPLTVNLEKWAEALGMHITLTHK